MIFPNHVIDLLYIQLMIHINLDELLWQFKWPTLQFLLNFYILIWKTKVKKVGDLVMHMGGWMHVLLFCGCWCTWKVVFNTNWNPFNCVCVYNIYVYVCVYACVRRANVCTVICLTLYPLFFSTFFHFMLLLSIITSQEKKIYIQSSDEIHIKWLTFRSVCAQRCFT